MKKIFLMMIASSALMACSPAKTETTTSTATTTETTTDTTTATTETASADATVASDATTTTETTTTTTETASDATVDTASDAAVDMEASGTMANDDTANVADEIDMAAGDGIEGKVDTWDATGRTFTMMEGDKPITVVVTDQTQYMDGTDTWDVDGFYGEDRVGQDIAVEGTMDSATNTITATKITRK